MKNHQRKPSLQAAACLLFLAGGATLAPSFAAPAPALCEAGPRAPEQTPFTAAQLADAALEVSERLGAELAASAVPRQQALAHYLLADARAERSAANQRAQRPHCERDHACSAQLTQLARQARAAELRALAALASASADADIYGMAYAQCNALPGQAPDPSCAPLSVQGWRTLAPQRAEPLVALAMQAWQKGDQDAVVGALRNIADLPALPAVRAPAQDVLATDAFQSLPARERYLAAMQLARGISTWSLAPLTMHFCSGKEMQDPARKQLCGELAAKMVDKNGLMLDNLEGRRIGKAAGWPRERLAASKEISQLKKAVRQTLGTTEDKNCAYLESLGKLAQATLEQGEVAAYAGFFAREQAGKPQR